MWFIQGSRKEADSTPDVLEQKVALGEVERQFNPSDYDDELAAVLSNTILSSSGSPSKPVETASS